MIETRGAGIGNNEKNPEKKIYCTQNWWVLGSLLLLLSSQLKLNTEWYYSLTKTIPLKINQIQTVLLQHIQVGGELSEREERTDRFHNNNNNKYERSAWTRHALTNLARLINKIKLKETRMQTEIPISTQLNERRCCMGFRLANVAKSIDSRSRWCNVLWDFSISCTINCVSLIERVCN